MAWMCKPQVLTRVSFDACKKHWSQIIPQWPSNRVEPKDHKSCHLNELGMTRITRALQRRHNDRDCVSNHQPHNCLLNCHSGANQRKHQSSASLAFVRGINRSPVNSPHKRPVTRNMFPFDDVIMDYDMLWLYRYMCHLYHFDLSLRAVASKGFGHKPSP